MHMKDNDDNDERPRDGDYRKDDEKPQIVQLQADDLTKEEVEREMTKAKEGMLRLSKTLSLFLRVSRTAREKRSSWIHLKLMF